MASLNQCSQESKNVGQLLNDTFSTILVLNDDTENAIFKLLDFIEETKTRWKKSQEQRQMYAERVGELENQFDINKKLNTELKFKFDDSVIKINAILTEKSAAEKELTKHKNLVKKFRIDRSILSSPAILKNTNSSVADENDTNISMVNNKQC